MKTMSDSMNPTRNRNGNYRLCSKKFNKNGLINWTFNRPPHIPGTIKQRV